VKLNLWSAIVFGIIMTLLISACATTNLISVWKDPLFQSQPRKFLIIGVAKKTANKRIFEDEFVRQLKARGVNAVASYTVMPDMKQGDHEVIAAIMKEYAADAVIISRLVSKKSVLSYVPGSFHVVPSTYGNWRDYYAYGSQVMYTPGYTAEEDFALMETNLYDAGNDKLIWSVESETEILGSDQSQIKSFIGVMVHSMAEQKLLK